jgi:sarcosine oxidase delta subunit
MTMLYVECPWCEGRATLEPVAGDDATFCCPDCAIRVELAAAPSVESVPLAA